MAMRLSIVVGELQKHFLLEGQEVCQSIAEVKAFCFGRYPKLKHYPKLKIFWNDKDGDDICIVTDQDGDYESLALAVEYPKSCIADADATALGEPEPRANTAPAAAPSAPAEDTAGFSLHSRICCACSRVLVSDHHRCITCHSLDLCNRCIDENGHSDHITVYIPCAIPDRTQSQVMAKLEQCIAKMMDDVSLASTDGGETAVDAESSFLQACQSTFEGWLISDTAPEEQQNAATPAAPPTMGPPRGPARKIRRPRQRHSASANMPAAKTAEEPLPWKFSFNTDKDKDDKRLEAVQDGAELTRPCREDPDGTEKQTVATVARKPEEPRVFRFRRAVPKPGENIVRKRKVPRLDKTR